MLCGALSCPAASLEQIAIDHFVFWYAPQDRTAARFLSRRADAIADELSQLIGFTLRQKVLVVLARRHEDFQRFAPDAPAPPSWAVGAAYPERNTILLFLKRRADLEKTFRHEVHHILLDQAFQGSTRVPRWLDEGLALLQADEWSLQRLATMTQAVLSKKIIPMEELTTAFPDDPERADIAYCQSFYFISFLKAQFGDDAFKKFLHAYSGHRDFPAALRSAYGCPWEELQSRWLDYMKLRFSWIPIITSTSTVWFIATVVFLAGYIRKRRQSRLRLQAWQQQEAAEGKNPFP